MVTPPAPRGRNIRMFEPKPNALCHAGVHRWNEDPDQAGDEIGDTRDCYCSQCHIDRFHEQYLPATRLDAWLDAARTCAARLRHRAITMLCPAPPPPPVMTPPKPRVEVLMPPVPRPDTTNAQTILIGFVTTRQEHAEHREQHATTEPDQPPEC